VSHHWSLLPTGQVAIELCDCSLPDFPRWSNMFLFSPDGSGVTPQLHWLWQVSTSPKKVRQLSVVPHSQSYEISSAICPSPTLGGWLLTPPLLSEVSSVFCLSLHQAVVNSVLCLWCSILLGRQCNLPTSCAGQCGFLEGRWCVSVHLLR
jgi:hypothetical protein